MQVSQQRFFYGWIIVAVAIIIIALGVGLMLSLGIFMQPLEMAFGWGRGQIAGASLFGWVAFGVASFFFGALSDRLGTRLVVMLGGLMFGAGMLALSRMQVLWHLYALYGLLIGGGIGAFLVPLTSTVTRWFTRRRALMVAVTNCGIGLGGTLFAPLTRYLVMAHGWRTAFALYGLLVWVVILPLTLLLRNRPQDIGLQPLGGVPVDAPQTPPIAEATLRDILQTPAFWIIALVHLLCCAAHSGPIFHMVSAAIDAGVGKLAAATILSSASLASIAGRIGTGILADRFGSKTILVTWLFMQALAVVLYLFVGNYGSFTLVGVYFGISYGGVMPLYAVVTRDLFGDRAMGASYGGIFFLSCIGMGLGAWGGGQLFDHTGTYGMMYVLSFLYGSAGAILALWLRAPRPQSPMAMQPQPIAMS
jgi:sugar phosphate permease